MNMSEKIRFYRKEKGLTQQELGDIVHKSSQVISNWERGYTTTINQDDIVNISVALNVPVEKLLDDIPLILGNSPFNHQTLAPLPTEDKRVPIIGTVRCGPGGFAYEYLDGFVMVDSDMTGDIRAFHCKGDSMVGLGIFDGDIAIVRIQDEIENGEIAVVVINGDEGTLKRVRKHDGMIILEAANPSYPPRIFNGEEANSIHIVGKVLETRRKY